jgi:uncharacterized membrane protein
MSATGDRWVLRRNCSAGPLHLAAVFGSTVAIAVAFGVAFAAAGLWMVLPFAAAELIAVVLAFLLYARHAADWERIDLRGSLLCVQRAEGPRIVSWQFPAARARVEIEAGGSHVYVGCTGAKVEIGRLVLEPNRLRLAHELRRALGAARNGSCG